MGAQDFLICPSCGSRNKVKWELCVRCGESLQGVSGEQSRVAASPSPEKMGRPQEVPIWPIVAAIAALAAGVAFWRSGWGKGELKRPDPAAFTMATVPPKRAEAPPRPSSEKFAQASGLVAAKQYEQAFLLFDEILVLEPGNAHFHAAYAQALWDAQRRDDALLQFREAAQLSPKEYRLTLAGRLSEAGRKDDARAEYEAMLAANPADRGAMRGYGSLLTELKDYARAAEVLERAGKDQPQDPDLMAGIAYALEKPDPKRAIDLYRDLLKQDAGRALVRARLADLVATQGNRDEALQLYKEGLQRDPGAPLLQQGLGNVYEKMGRYKDAAGAYREYARLNPNAPLSKILVQRAALLERAGS
jgi:tetratricopeptide (TPR) repeat protein